MKEPLPRKANHRTLRAMAKLAGISASMGQTIRKAHGLSPVSAKSQPTSSVGHIGFMWMFFRALRKNNLKTWA